MMFIILWNVRMDKGDDYGLSWKWKGAHTSKLNLLYTVFFHNIKLSAYKMGTKLDKYPLAAEQDNYTIKMFTLSMI